MRTRDPLLSLLAGLTGLVAAWPITTLIRSGHWIGEATLLVAVAIAVGIVTRRLRVPEPFVILLQTASILGLLWLLFVRGSQEPTLDTVRALITEADTTIRKFAAPAPETEGLRFAIVGLVALLTMLIDTLAVGLRSPALAGLPAMSIYLISAANTTEGLPAHYFLAAAVCWLLMVGVTARDEVDQWSNTTARATAPTLLGDRLGLGSFASVARALGVVALVGALVLPNLIPTAPQRYLGEGLGRSPKGTVGTVGLSNTLDVGRSLVSNDRTPVLTYNTEDPTPPPLRVMVSSSYDDGAWTADDPSEPTGGRDGARMQGPVGLAARAGFVEQKATFTSGTLQAGLLAAPTPTLRADLSGGSWSYDLSTSVISPQRSTSRYSVDYARMGPSARPSSTAPVQGFERDLALDPRPLAQLRRTLSQIPSATTPFDRAIEIQNYLRGDGGFSYSLTLAPTRTSINGAAVDPITNFLLTKQGYCVQFATAMIMLARLERIPARMAIGFLPGTSSVQTSSYTVIQSDAHAWPELYFPGLGWTRFEPTPGSRSGSVPDYTVPQTVNTKSETTEPTSSSNTSEESTRATISSTPSSTGGGNGPTIVGTALKYLGWLVLAALVLGALGSLLPFAARREAEHRRRAETTAHQVEGDWTTMQDDLSDLGLAPPPEQSPRAQQEHYRKLGALSGESSAALGRATATLERARYGRPDDTLDLRADSRVVVESVRRNAAFRNRMLHRLAPRTGRRWLRRKLHLPGGR